jgi:RNA polymerase sigma-70 factor (ECF subfamily)
VSALARDVTAWSDAGGKVPAATRPIVGQDAVVRFLLGLMRKSPRGLSIAYEEVNLGPALLSWLGEDVDSVLAFDVAGEHIQALRLLLNPDKLVYLRHQLRLRAEATPRSPL